MVGMDNIGGVTSDQVLAGAKQLERVGATIAEAAAAIDRFGADMACRGR